MGARGRFWSELKHLVIIVGIYVRRVCDSPIWAEFSRWKPKVHRSKIYSASEEVFQRGGFILVFGSFYGPEVVKPGMRSASNIVCPFPDPNVPSNH